MSLSPRSGSPNHLALSVRLLKSQDRISIDGFGVKAERYGIAGGWRLWPVSLVNETIFAHGFWCVSLKRGFRLIE